MDLYVNSRLFCKKYILNVNFLITDYILKVYLRLVTYIGKYNYCFDGRPCLILCIASKILHIVIKW